MERTDQLKQELNRELRKEGKLQRAGLRKCRIVCQELGNYGEPIFFQKMNLDSDFDKMAISNEMWIDGNEGFLESKEYYFYHGIIKDSILLETQSGIAFPTNKKIRFIS